MSGKAPQFDLTPYKTARKRPGWAVALIWAAVIALCGVLGLVMSAFAGMTVQTIWGLGLAFAGVIVCCLIALIAYLAKK